MGSSVAADDVSLTEQEAADRVVAAVEAKDPQALAALAARPRPDPWLVADVLCARDAIAAAEAFAAAGDDAARLVTYVKSRKGLTDDVSARKAFAEIEAGLEANRFADALAHADETDAPENTVVWIRIAIARGHALRGLRKLDESSKALLAAAAGAEALGWNAALGTAYREAGISAAYRGDIPGALSAWEKALPVLEDGGEKVHLRQVLTGIGRIHVQLRAPAKALPYFQRALVVAEQTGDKRYIADAAADLANLHRTSGALDDALKHLERAEALEKELGNTARQAWVLKEMGEARLALGEFARAQAHVQRALFLFEQLGNKEGQSIALSLLGQVHRVLGDPVTALSFQQRSLDLAKELGDTFGVAATLISIGNVHLVFGNYVKALDAFSRALDSFKELRHKPGAAAALASVGSAHEALGDYAKALAYHESALRLFRELGDEVGVATTYANLGNVYSDLGDHERARTFIERALGVYQKLNRMPDVATQLSNLGDAYTAIGDYDEALTHLNRALAIQHEIMDKPGTATVYENIGAVHAERGEYEKALEFLQRALPLHEQMKDRAQIATALSKIGEIQVKLGRREEGLTSLRRALREARSRRIRPLVVWCLRTLAGIHLDGGEVELALSEAQQALSEIEHLLGRLDDEQGASARGRYTDVFEIGALAAARANDPGLAATFLESGRAGSLLETLGGRTSLRWEDLPEHLRQAESLAAAEEERARQAHRKASEGGNLAAIRETAAALEAASKRVAEVAARNQRQLKGHARHLFYPRAATVEEIRDELHRGEALIIYGLCRSEALAMVLTPDTERIAMLGDVADVTAACAALRASERESDPAAALTRLGELLVKPLGLKKNVKRVLVSPEGPLCYVPFGALFRQPAALTPSGTTHVLLKKETSARGSKVLALGNPTYTELTKVEREIYVRGRELTPLPATGPEARAVGDVVLLGAEASEELLYQTLLKSKRWRAVHLACHGIVNDDHPTHSFLALSKSKDEDGFLTAREVLRMNVPTDLAVLSACETATGEIVKGEGILGLTRSFMYAGAPRVLCSLWKVDDRATQALMSKFYELWNPKEGDGIAAAEALKQAQSHVRSHEEWRHPFYWAAWVLWGLPE